MIDLAVYNRQGQQVETFSVDESVFGGKVRTALLKQALVMYHANRRVGTATTKSRGMVEGSTRKLYRQKGTGNARAGTVRTNIRRGGGMAHAKQMRDFRQDMPQKQRRLATNSAILAKLQSADVVVIDELKFAAPKTKDFAKILDNLGINKSCLVATSTRDENVWKSVRNVPRTALMPVADLNAADICSRKKILFTKDAFAAVVDMNKNKA